MPYDARLRNECGPPAKGGTGGTGVPSVYHCLVFSHENIVVEASCRWEKLLLLYELRAYAHVYGHIRPIQGVEEITRPP